MQIAQWCNVRANISLLIVFFSGRQGGRERPKKAKRSREMHCLLII